MMFQNQPFSLDYHQTLMSLLDVLSEVYNKISKILGPSPFPSSGSSHMMGPLGLLSPHPGVSYLFSGAEAASLGDGEGSLWSIANAQGPAGAVVYGGALGSPPPNWNSGLGDTVKAIDSKLKVAFRFLSLRHRPRCRGAEYVVLFVYVETHCDFTQRTRRLCACWDQRRTGLARSIATERIRHGRTSRGERF